MPTRRQRRRWAAQGGRPRDRRVASNHPGELWRFAVPCDITSFRVTLDGKLFESPTLHGLAEQLREEGHRARIDGSTLRFEHRPPEAVTATFVPNFADTRVLEVHHDNRAKWRARGER